VELQHSFTVPADVDTAWATLLDLEGVAPCFPGATLTGHDGDEFTGQVKVKLGPVSLQYSGKGRFVERDDDAHRAVIEAHGSDKRGNGTAGATVVAHLAQEGEKTTRVVVETQLKVTGRPAQFGRGVMQDVGSRIVDQFANQLARQLSGETVGANGGERVSAGGSGNGTSGAAGAQAASLAEEPAVPVAVASEAAQAAPAGPSIADATAPNAGPRPSAPRPAPTVPSGYVDKTDNELDLNAVVLPVLARQYGPTLLAVLVTAVVTWIIARRKR
jgi:carbon monoxide dehydrogenase subunit G